MQAYCVFLLSSVLIDVDHLLIFIFKHKATSLKRLVDVASALREKMQAQLYIFHSPEFNLLLVILAFSNFYALLLLASNIIHISLDILEHYDFHRDFYFIKEGSIFYNLMPLKESNI